MASKTVLISGAGIAGPTLAYWLRERGFEPTIVEVAPAFREGGYMIDFWAIGFDVAEKMGLITRLREVGYHIDSLQFVDDEDHTRSQIGAQTLSAALGERFLSILRGDLAKAIYDSVSGTTETLFGEEITVLRDTPDGVEVEFKNASPRTFDLVVGADGLHSRVRELAFGPESEYHRYLGYYAASFITEGYPRRDEHAYTSFAEPGRQISRYALREDRTAFLFVFRREQPYEGRIDEKAVLREVFGEDPWVERDEVLERMDETDELYFDSVSQIHMPSWSKGRVALIGDAAYCPSLLAGEGSAFAMAGAYILAGELGRSADHASAFAAYEDQFRAFIERKQKGAEKFASSFAPSTNFGLWMRDIILHATAIPGVGKWLGKRLFVEDFDLPEF